MSTEVQLTPIPEPQRQCPRCSADLPPGAGACGRCGLVVDPQAGGQRAPSTQPDSLPAAATQPICPRCNRVAEPGAIFVGTTGASEHGTCPNCGTPLVLPGAVARTAYEEKAVSCAPHELERVARAEAADGWTLLDTTVDERTPGLILAYFRRPARAPASQTPLPEAPATKASAPPAPAPQPATARRPAGQRRSVAQKPSATPHPSSASAHPPVTGPATRATPGAKPAGKAPAAAPGAEPDGQAPTATTGAETPEIMSDLDRAAAGASRTAFTVLMLMGLFALTLKFGWAGFFIALIFLPRLLRSVLNLPDPKSERGRDRQRQRRRD